MTSLTPTCIWARSSAPPTDRPVLLWNSFGDPSQHPNTISLPTFIEKNARDIRSQLLAFLCDAKYVTHSGANLEESLVTTEGLSTWWLSFPSLKQWGKRQSIPIACRLIAIELILGADRLHDISIEADDDALSELITRSLKGSSSYRYRLARSVVRRVIHPLRAIASLLRYLIQTRAVPRRQSASPLSTASSIAFFDYFSGTDRPNGSTGPYISPYWGMAPTLAIQPHWYHVYPRNVDYHGVHSTLRSIAELNAQGTHLHHLFLGRLTPKDCLNIFKAYIRQSRIHRRFRKDLLEFCSPGTKTRLWNVFEDEWDDSIVGSTALRHLILLVTTNKMVAQMPTYDKIFYLMENQPWELALTHCVRRQNKGALIGVAHSTIRFWDLRYFSDERENNYINPGSRRPHPDRICVNGEIGRGLLLDNGYPAASISVVEALRYMYLHDLRGTSESSSGHLLLLGDFLEHANEVLVKVFREAMAQLPEHRAIKVRSHPICPLTPDQLGPLTANVSSDPLAKLLRTTSVVITTAASSSAAESAALGIPTIVILDARSLNYSPFRQTDNVYVVENATQLAQLLENEVQLKPQPVDTIFCLDPQYPRWRMELNPT